MKRSTKRLGRWLFLNQQSNMDDNTTKVLMALIALISAIVTPLVLVIVTKMQNKKIDANQVVVVNKQKEIVQKLDESHKQMNGNLDKLIKSTADLATLTEKNKHTNK